MGGAATAVDSFRMPGRGKGSCVGRRGLASVSNSSSSGESLFEEG